MRMSMGWVYNWQTMIAGIVAVVGAIGGGVLAYGAGVKQARATHRATEASTKSMLERSQLVERANISGGGVRARKPTPGSGRLVETGEFEFHFNNYGKTPGTLYKLGYGFCEETAIPERPRYIFEYYNEPIDPGRRGEPFVRHQIPPQLYAPVVYGRFYYKTVFSTRHSSGFIYRIQPNSDPQSIPPPSPDFIRDQDEPDEK
jgi:hypothetical protein